MCTVNGRFLVNYPCQELHWNFTKIANFANLGRNKQFRHNLCFRVSLYQVIRRVVLSLLFKIDVAHTLNNLWISTNITECKTNLTNSRKMAYKTWCTYIYWAILTILSSKLPKIPCLICVHYECEIPVGVAVSLVRLNEIKQNKSPRIIMHTYKSRKLELFSVERLYYHPYCFNII